MTKEEIKEKLEEIFKAEEIDFKLLDFDDDDINYGITFDASDIVPYLGDLDCILYVDTKKYRLCIMMGGIYTFDDKDTDEYALKICNEVNQLMAYGGKVVYFDNTKNLAYIDNFFLSEISELNTKLIRKLLVSLMASLVVIHDELKDNNQDEK